MRFEAFKIGELARRTGLTVRTLHHYDAIGLLKPSVHSDAGYRLYTAGDVARLQQVLSLRQLGFSLEEIRDCLDRPGFAPLEVIGLHIARLQVQMELQRKLCERLETLAAHLRAAETVSAEEFLQTIEEMTRMEKYFTSEQLERIQKARQEAGKEYLQQKQEEWAELIALVRAEMEKGTDPADAKVQELTKRWLDLLHWTTGGDPEMEQSLKRHWEEEGDTLAARYGSKYDSRPVWGYIRNAMAILKGQAQTPKGGA